ncbi:hypothetical protein B0H13DRAFT_1857554 [Mycena leptocephala]|nr:hypothetical protein B0H13DRAFT_1857554 [Mycena leptocephala]
MTSRISDMRIPMTRGQSSCSEGEGEEDEEDEDDNDPPAQSGYEPHRTPVDPESDIHMSDPESSAVSSSTVAPSREVRKAAEDCFHHKPIIEHYPGSRAGKPVAPRPGKTAEEEYESSLLESSSGNPYAPFKSKMDWEVAKWAKLRGSGSTAFTDLLNVEGVRSALDLSYSNSVQLNKIIDEKLPGRPKFTRSEVVVNGEFLLPTALPASKPKPTPEEENARIGKLLEKTIAMFREMVSEEKL